MFYLVLQKVFALFLATVSFFTNISAMFQSQNPADAAATRVHYGEGPCEYYDMYVPENAKGNVNVVLMIHGGAWVFGDQSEFADYCKTASEDYGYVAVTIDYDKIFNGKTSADMVYEIAAAVQSIKDQTESMGLKAEKMVVAGHSAGAHIALLYSYVHYADSPIDIAFIVSNSAPTDFFDEDGAGTTTMERFSNLAVSGLIGKLVLPGHEDEFADEIKANNPIDLLNSCVPPTIVVYGAKDSMVSCTNSKNLYAKLDDYGVDSVLIEYPDSDHFLKENPEMNEVRSKAFFEFAEKYL